MCVCVYVHPQKGENKDCELAKQWLQRAHDEEDEKEDIIQEA